MHSVFVGHDWAEDHHDIHIEDCQGASSGRVASKTASTESHACTARSPNSSGIQPRC